LPILCCITSYVPNDIVLPVWLCLTVRVQSWLAKGLQSGACRSPRRSKASQDGPHPLFPPGGEDPARPSIVDLMPDSDGEKEAADLRASSRWGSDSRGVSSKVGGLGLQGGSLRLVQARTDLADEG
jgi:hypothetical protein